MRKLIAGRFSDVDDQMFWQVGLLYFNTETAEPEYQLTAENQNKYSSHLSFIQVYTSCDERIAYTYVVDKHVNVFNRSRRTHETIIVPRNCNQVYSDTWYTTRKRVKRDRIMKDTIDTLRFLNSSDSYEFEGIFDLRCVYEFGKKILIEVEAYKKITIGLFDLDKLEFIWNIPIERGLVKHLNDDLFVLKRKDNAHLYSVQTGELVRSLGFSGNTSYSVPGHVVIYNSINDVLYSYHVESGSKRALSLKNLWAKDERYYLNVCSDEVFLYLPYQDKLNVYSLSESKLLRSWFLPKHLFAEGDIRWLEVCRIKNNLVVNITHRGQYQSAECQSTYIFNESELSEFESDHVVPVVCNETIACLFERTPAENDLVDFKVTFPEKETFSTVYRHLAEQGDCLIEEFGWLSLYPNPTLDKSWSGHIVYELSNQSFDEQERHELYLLARSQLESYIRCYRAGYDSDARITVDVIFDDKLVKARIMDVDDAASARTPKTERSPLKISGVSKSSLYKHRQQLRKLGWLDAEESLPGSEVKLWVALAQYNEEKFWIADSFSHEDESYYGSLLKWINTCCDKKLGITRIESRHEFDGDDEYTVVSYKKKQKTIEQRYLNEPRQISQIYLDELAQLAGMKGLRLVFNEKLGMLGCIPGDIEL